MIKPRMTSRTKNAMAPLGLKLRSNSWSGEPMLDGGCDFSIFIIICQKYWPANKGNMIKIRRFAYVGNKCCDSPILFVPARLLCGVCNRCSL